jgi:DNA adenine methylase
MDYLSFAKDKLEGFRKRDAAIRAAWPPDWLAAWSEEVKSIETENGHSREQAERLAQDWAALGVAMGDSADSWTRKSTNRLFNPDEGNQPPMVAPEYQPAMIDPEDQAGIPALEPQQEEAETADVRAIASPEQSTKPLDLTEKDLTHDAPEDDRTAPRELRLRLKPLPKKLRPCVKTHGGKNYLARRIIKLLPSDRTYIEPFAGGLSVLLNKPRAAVEVASDLNPDLIGLYHVLQSDFGAIAGRLDPLLYDGDIFNQAASWLASNDPLEHAIGFLVRNRFSRDGLGKDFSWSERPRGKTRPCGPQPGDKNAWETLREHLPMIAERLRGVDIRCAPAIDVIREYDRPDTTHYCDPPYLHSTRTAHNIYQFEMSTADHEELLDVLLGCRGTVVLSGYPSPLYDARLAGWRRVVFDMPNHAGQGKTKQRREEVIWINR